MNSENLETVPKENLVFNGNNFPNRRQRRFFASKSNNRKMTKGRFQSLLGTVGIDTRGVLVYKGKTYNTKGIQIFLN